MSIRRFIALSIASASGAPNRFYTVGARTPEEIKTAIELNRQLLKLMDSADRKIGLVQNNLACAIFLSGDQSFLREADLLSQAALDSLPMLLSVRSTCGSVLIAIGEYEEGLKYLEDERFCIEASEYQEKVQRIRARAYHALGRLDDANDSLELHATGVG